MKPQRTGAHGRPAITPVDLAFGLIVVGTAVTQMRMSRGSWFVADDWPLSLRGHSASDLLEPYNNHLSITYIAVYRLLYALFGMDTYTPFRLAGIACLLAVSIALFLVLRPRVGPWVAGLVGSLVLWFPNIVAMPAALNHYLAVLGAVVCAWGLTKRGRTGDVVVAGALAFSLCSTGGGLAVLVACFVFAACTRADRRRWIAIAVPSGLWAMWWLAYGRAGSIVADVSTQELIRNALDGVLNSSADLMLGHRGLGIVLLGAYGGHLVSRARQGRVAVASGLAWTAALVVWWTGLAYTRGDFLSFSPARYAFVGAVFIVLALVPPEGLELPGWTRSLPAAIALLVAVGGMASVTQPGIDQEWRFERGLSDAIKLEMIIANLGPEVVPDDFRFSMGLAITGRQYREIIDRFGYPEGTRPKNVDEQLVELAGIELRAVPSGRPCRAEVPVLRAPPASHVRVRAGATPTTVYLLRFGEVPIPIGDLRADQVARLALPRLLTARPWVVMAEDACISLVEPTR